MILEIFSIFSIGRIDQVKLRGDIVYIIRKVVVYVSDFVEWNEMFMVGQIVFQGIKKDFKDYVVRG